jgi:hypothetical protein
VTDRKFDSAGPSVAWGGGEGFTDRKFDSAGPSVAWGGGEGFSIFLSGDAGAGSAV